MFFVSKWLTPMNLLYELPLWTSGKVLNDFHFNFELRRSRYIMLRWFHFQLNFRNSKRCGPEFHLFFTWAWSKLAHISLLQFWRSFPRYCLVCKLAMCGNILISPVATYKLTLQKRTMTTYCETDICMFIPIRLQKSYSSCITSILTIIFYFIHMVHIFSQ